MKLKTVARMATPPPFWVLIIAFVLVATACFAKPLTFVTYHATSQYYPNMSASQIAAIVPYGGKLKLKTEPELDYTYAKKKLRAGNLLSEGDVQFGGTEETKGGLQLKNVSGTAKSLEAVDANIENLYLYNIQFPNPGQEMQWKELNVKTTGNNIYTATFLTQKPNVSKCEYLGTTNCSGNCPADLVTGRTDDQSRHFYSGSSYNTTAVLAHVKQPGTYYDVYYYNYPPTYAVSSHTNSWEIVELYKKTGKGPNGNGTALERKNALTQAFDTARAGYPDSYLSDPSWCGNQYPEGRMCYSTSTYSSTQWCGDGTMTCDAANVGRSCYTYRELRGGDWWPNGWTYVVQKFQLDCYNSYSGGQGYAYAKFNCY